MKKFSEVRNSKKVFKQIIENIDEQENLLNQETNTNTSKSEVVNFFSKLFESKEMAHVYHLQVKGDQGSYAKHKALGDYYETMLELLDELIETYQGQYGLVEGYDIIDTSTTKTKESVDYFEELANWLKHAKNCISDEDTHLHSLIDDIFCLIYKTIYKLKFLK